MKILARLRQFISAVGGVSTVQYLLLRGLRRTGHIRPKELSKPLLLRGGSSDHLVFQQIFVEREYAPLDDLDHVDVILDCGANVGYSAVYFLARFPGCKVVAIEPDPVNFEILRQNLEPYGERAIPVHGGVWSSCCSLAIRDVPYRDGREWTRQVEVSEPGAPTSFPGVDIPWLVQLGGGTRVSLLKMDIEGAEAVIFGGDTHKWLHSVDNIAIELHDDTSFGDGSSTFHHAIGDEGFTVTRSGELTICKR